MSNPVIERYYGAMTSQGWRSNQHKNPEAKALGEGFKELQATLRGHLLFCSTLWHLPFTSEQSRHTAAPEVHKQARRLEMQGLD